LDSIVAHALLVADFIDSIDPKRTHCPPVAAEGHIRCVVWRFG
jgi:hypothetical protein